MVILKSNSFVATLVMTLIKVKFFPGHWRNKLDCFQETS